MLQGSHYFQDRGRSDPFRGIKGRSGRQQKEVGRLLRVVNCLIENLIRGHVEVTLSDLIHSLIAKQYDYEQLYTLSYTCVRNCNY